MTRPVALFVMGMHRSGTSALTRVLTLCGGALPAALQSPNSSNPAGYWEPRKAIEINEAILRRHSSNWTDPSLRSHSEGAFSSSKNAADVAEIGAFLGTLPAAPLVIIKDPRITVLSEMWFEAALQAGFDIATVVAVRHPQEVTASLAARDQVSAELGSALWLKYNLLAERHTRDMPRLFVEYGNLLDNWRREIKRVSSALSLDLATPRDGEIESFLRQDLRHQRKPGRVLEFFGSDWLSRVYGTLEAATRDKPWESSSLDRVYLAYGTSEHDFRIVFEDFRKHFDFKSVFVRNLLQFSLFKRLRTRL